MADSHDYRLLADAVLLLHFALVLFVVGSVPAILIGWARGWDWVRHRSFRLAHLAAIAVIAVQAWLGVVCPLTWLEVRLRERAGEVAYAQTFVQHWVERWLFFDAPLWIFTAAYSAFAVLVAWLWWRVPVRR